jgi:hypothetical protein
MVNKDIYIYGEAKQIVEYRSEASNITCSIMVKQVMYYKCKYVTHARLPRTLPTSLFT